VASNKSQVTSEKTVKELAAPQQEARAFGRYLKISPTKVQDLARLIRGKRVAEAETILKFSGVRGGEVVLKVLHSAEANAGTGFDKESWIVAEARADRGPIFRRRIDPKSRGSRGLITTNSTHFKIVIREQKTVNQEKHRPTENEQMVRSAAKRSGDGA